MSWAVRVSGSAASIAVILSRTAVSRKRSATRAMTRCPSSPQAGADRGIKATKPPAIRTIARRRCVRIVMPCLLFVRRGFQLIVAGCAQIPLRGSGKRRNIYHGEHRETGKPPAGIWGLAEAN